MGLLRYCLAICVLLFHFGYSYGSLQLGPSAVTAFFIISGYSMSQLYKKRFAHNPQEALSFWIDRALRIYPQLLFYMGFSLAICLICGLNNFGAPATSEDFRISHIAAEIIVSSTALLANFEYMWQFLLPPSAWSLGSELQFYFLLPLLLWASPLGRIGIFFISAGCFLCAYGGILNPDMFGYRLLPGTLYIFFLGILLAKGDAKSYFLLASLWIMALGLGIGCFWMPVHYDRIYSVLLGIVIGLPLIILCIKKPIRHPVDAFLGHLSYGVYLSHFPLLHVLLHYFPIHNLSKEWGEALVLIALSTLVSLFSYWFIERPFRRLRKSRYEKQNELFKAPLETANLFS